MEKFDQREVYANQVRIYRSCIKLPAFHQEKAMWSYRMTASKGVWKLIIDEKNRSKVEKCLNSNIKIRVYTR
jgi:hypothetical protein